MGAVPKNRTRAITATNSTIIWSQTDFCMARMVCCELDLIMDQLSDVVKARGAEKKKIL